jgi:hypothetical protein
MHRLIKPIFWTFLFLVMMLVIDQVLVQVPPIHPAHAAVRNFYQDFRSRITDFALGEKKATPKSIEAVIAKQQKETTPKKTEQTKELQAEATPTPKTQKGQRYIYSDGKGELHFADSLDDVPDGYRGLAQPMGK